MGCPTRFYRTAGNISPGGDCGEPHPHDDIDEIKRLGLPGQLPPRQAAIDTRIAQFNVTLDNLIADNVKLARASRSSRPK
jgi:hypothetical protein